MRNIVITNGRDTVTLLPAIHYEIVPEEIGTSATMASGRKVFDFVGTKNKLKVPTGWLSSSDLAKLREMIHTDHLLTITYEVPEGERTDLFLVNQPKLKTFRYDEAGVDLWCGVTLEADMYEVYT